MANEIALTFSLTVNKPSVMTAADGMSISGATFTMTGNLIQRAVVSIGTSPTAIPLGQVTAPHWAVFHNLDPTNYITIRNGSGGADLIQLLGGTQGPNNTTGDWGILPLLSTSTPYAVANIAACLMEYLIISL